MEEQTIEDAQVGNLVGQGQQIQNSVNQQQYIMEEQERSLAEAQLECHQTLRELYHRLKQDRLVPDENGNMEWVPIDEKERNFTDTLLDKAMQVVSAYINKETLLSNFDEEIIKRRMLKFCLAFNGNLYGKYELYFRIPTIEECMEILESQIEDKVKMRMYSLELLGDNPDKEKVRQEILKQYGSSFEDEIANIKFEKMQENLREYELLFTQIEALVETIHRRAWKGEERGSLRRHSTTQEIIGKSTQPAKTGMFSWRK